MFKQYLLIINNLCSNLPNVSISYANCFNLSFRNKIVKLIIKKKYEYCVMAYIFITIIFLFFDFFNIKYIIALKKTAIQHNKKVMLSTLC